MDIENGKETYNEPVPVTIDLEHSYYVFQQPKNSFVTHEKTKIDSFKVDSTENNFVVTYKPAYGPYQNAEDLEKHKLKMKGTSTPLRNHLFAIRKTSQGCKLIPIKSLVSFTQVYENEDKIHVAQKVDLIKVKGPSDSRFNDLHVL